MIVIAADPNFILRRMEKYVSTAGAREDLDIALAANTVVNLVRDHLKEAMNFARYKELRDSTTRVVRAGRTRISEKNGRIEVLINPNMLFSEKLREQFSDNYKRLQLPLIMLSSVNKGYAGSFDHKLNTVEAYIPLEKGEFDSVNFIDYWKAVEAVRKILVHELVHYVDLKRSNGKADMESARKEFETGNKTAYINDPLEVNARYHETIHAMLKAMFERMYDVENDVLRETAKEIFPKPRPFVDQFTRRMRDFSKLDQTNKRKIYRRAIKLWHELTEMDRSKFFMLRKRGMADKFVSSHLLRLKRIDEKKEITAGAKDDITVVQAAQTMINAASNHIKKTMTKTSYQKVVKQAEKYHKRYGGHGGQVIYEYYKPDDDKIKIDFLNQNALRDPNKPVEFAVLIRMAEFLPKSDNPRNNLAFYFSSQPPVHFEKKDKVGGVYFDKPRIIWIKIDPSATAFTEDNWSLFWKELYGHKILMQHEITHWVDAFRTGGAAKSQGRFYKDDMPGYMNEVVEVNARYMEGVYQHLWYLARLYGINKLTDKYKTATHFMNELMLMKVMPGFDQLNSENRKRVIKRWYKLYDELKAMPEEEFVKFKDKMKATQWVAGHVKRMQKLEKNAPRPAVAS